jgi:acetyl/propionyl-CoA carboxylase alpha subunit
VVNNSLKLGNKLPLEQKELNIFGHSFEARIYSENPGNNFLIKITIFYPAQEKLDISILQKKLKIMLELKVELETVMKFLYIM